MKPPSLRRSVRRSWRRHARLLALPLLGAAPVVGCSSAPDRPANEAVAKTSAALDPNQVLEPVWYNVTLSRLQVNVAQEPDQSGLAIQQGENCQTSSDGTPYANYWTPDTGFVDVGQLGLQVVSHSAAGPFNGGNVWATACSMGSAPAGKVFPASPQGGYCTGTALGTALDPSNELTINFSMNPLDSVRLALSMDDAEQDQVSAMTSSVSNSLSTDLKDYGDLVKLAGSLFSVAGAGVGGTAIGLVGAGLSVAGDDLALSGAGACNLWEEASFASSCVGGLMGPPSGVITDDCGGGACYFAQAAPDTLRIGDPTVVDPTTGKPVDLTAERLLELTAAGPLTLRFTPSYNMTGWKPAAPPGCAVLARGTLNSFGCALATSQPLMMVGCASSVTIDITISRLWGRTGPAASAKSGDMAVVRDQGTIDAIAVDASNPGQIVHYFGSGSGFKGENVYADASRVSLSMLPAVISRTTSNVDAFWSGSTGGLYTAYQAAPDYVWNEENILAPDVPVQFGTTHRVLWSNVPHDAIVTPVARAPGNMDVFYVARDGNVHDASWDSSSGLNAQGQPNWTDAAVTSSGSCMNATAPCAGSASPGGGVAAVARTPDTLDVFYVGTDGGLWNSSLANGAWTTQALYGPSTSAHTPAIAPAGAVITAAARSAHAMDVFFVANHGEIWHSMWADAAPVTAPGSFSTSEVDGTAGTGQPGGPISAVSPQPAAVDVVYGGARNGLMWTFIDATTGTTQTMPVANAAGISSSTLGRGAVSLVAPTSYTLQAFYVNSAHQIETITRNGPPCDLANCTVTPSNSQWTAATVLQPPPPPTACSGSSCGPLYLDQNDTPFEVEQGGSDASNLILAGSWVQADHGANATASVVSNPMPGSTITFYPGASSGSTATVEMMVSTTMATPPGSYIVRVQATDEASGTTETADVPVQVLACTPSPASEACGDPTACGAWSAGCGQTVDCGSCASGDTCMSGHCCPDGWTWSADMQRCESNAPPPTCPPTTPLCSATNTCLTAAMCSKAGGSGGGGCKGTTCM